MSDVIASYIMVRRFGFYLSVKGRLRSVLNREAVRLLFFKSHPEKKKKKEIL